MPFESVRGSRGGEGTEGLVMVIKEGGGGEAVLAVLIVPKNIKVIRWRLP